MLVLLLDCSFVGIAFKSKTIKFSINDVCAATLAMFCAAYLDDTINFGLDKFITCLSSSVKRK